MTDKELRKSGYTLVEVLVVVAIMGVLSSLGVASLRQAVMNNRTKGAAINTAAFIERVANEANRLSSPLCLKMLTNDKIVAMKGNNCTTATEQVAEYVLEAPVQFVSGNCSDLDGNNWIDASNANTSVFVPKLGLSAAPASGYICVRYGSSGMYGAASKSVSVNSVKPKMRYEATGSWTDL